MGIGSNKNDVFMTLKRGKSDSGIMQMTGKSDGISKGGKTGLGGTGPIKLSEFMHKEYAQKSAQTDGLCK